MHKIWFERPLPTTYAHLLAGVAVGIGSAADSPGSPFAAVNAAQAIIAGGRLDYDAAVMDRAPQLRVIARTGIGLNNVSIPAATARGIAVCNAPDAPTISTAEHTLALMLAVAKQLKWSDRTLGRAGKHDYFNEYGGFELYGRWLGLIGLGRIGSRVGQLALALGMKVAGFDPFIAEDLARERGIEPIRDLATLLGQADVVSLHIPLLPETRGMMDGPRLAQMKRGAILINAARGGLIDEEALLEALETGRLSGAGLDVFESEPPRPDHPLLARPDVIATPHVAAATGASKDRLWRTAIDQALQVLAGERPSHLVNPEVWT